MSRHTYGGGRSPELDKARDFFYVECVFLGTSPAIKKYTCSGVFFLAMKSFAEITVPLPSYPTVMFAITHFMA